MGRTKKAWLSGFLLYLDLTQIREVTVHTYLRLLPTPTLPSVTRWVGKKITQNVAQPFFVQINAYVTSTVDLGSQKI
jgi:hypothetical protein